MRLESTLEAATSESEAIVAARRVRLMVRAYPPVTRLGGRLTIIPAVSQLNTTLITISPGTLSHKRRIRLGTPYPASSSSCSLRLTGPFRLRPAHAHLLRVGASIAHPRSLPTGHRDPARDARLRRASAHASIRASRFWDWRRRPRAASSAGGNLRHRRVSLETVLNRVPAQQLRDK